MGKKDKNKFSTPLKAPVPASLPPPAPTPTPEQEQTRSFISKIASTLSTALGTANDEDLSAVAALPPPPESIDLKSAWNEAEQARRLWEKQRERAQDEERKSEAARRRYEEERARLDDREKQLADKQKLFDEQRKTQDQKARSEEAKLKEEREKLEKENTELLARQKKLQDEQTALLTREANAAAGFVEQQASALGALTQGKARLEAELSALPAKLAEAHAGWVKETEELRRRFNVEAQKARQQLEAELVDRRKDFDKALTEERIRARDSLETEREELRSARAELERLRKTQREESIKLRAERELLDDERQLLQKLIEQKAASRVAQLEADLKSQAGLLEDISRDRMNLQAELKARNEANQLFEQRSPREVLEQLRKLQHDNVALEQKLATRPSEHEKQRLQYLESQSEHQGLELARLKRENSELKARLGNYSIAVSELDSLRSQKEAAETYNALLQKSLEVYEQKVEGLIQRAKVQSAFPRCTEMDVNPDLKEEVEREERVPDLKIFCDDLQHRLAQREENRQPLYYRVQDVRAFVAGLAMSKLHLLQGISGTGKTSLPREFARAVKGDFTLIEVQAGWRDRDDLLGHFNAFEGRYYESDFLLSLYRAQTPAYQDRLCIVVLDEMNLSRPEQYFANLLAQLEQPENKRELRLTSDPQQQMPRLFKGNTLRIPRNVWFVGTANHDETTVEFADKTYDRAHVMELPRQRHVFQAVPKHDRLPISFAALTKAFDQARAANPTVARDTLAILEKQLAPALSKRFRVGWGNRLERQMADFIPVMLASGGSKVEAVDHLVATKLLRKIRGRHETQQEDLNELEAAVRSTFKLLGAGEPEQSLRIIEDERRMPRQSEEQGTDAV
jgi:hypothetical protein